MEAAQAHCHHCAYVSIYPPYPQGLRWARKNWKRVKFISSHLHHLHQVSCSFTLMQTWLINQINKFYWKTNPRLNIVQESDTATVAGCSTSISLRSVCGFPDLVWFSRAAQSDCFKSSDNITELNSCCSFKIVGTLRLSNSFACYLLSLEFNVKTFAPSIPCGSIDFFH